ncbi:LpqN/LpqT family lipoprotein [Nocardia sp. NPDC003482]
MTSGSPGGMPLSVAEYLNRAGVGLVVAHRDTVGAPIAEVLVPVGWRRVAAAAFPHAYGVWALPPAEGEGWADNAVLLIGRLTGEVDAAALLSCAFTSSRALPGWSEEHSGSGTFGGQPSAVISGRYSAGALRLWSSNRYLLFRVTRQQFLVQLTVTTRVESIRDGDAVAGSLRVRPPLSPSELEQAKDKSPDPGTRPEPLRHWPPGPVFDHTEDDEYFTRKRRTGWLE